MFDLSNVTLAYSTASAHEDAFDALTADMLCWHEAGEYPSPADLVSAITVAVPHLSKATIKTYASGILAWAKAGKTPKSIRAMSNERPAGHIKGKGGRPSKAEAADKATATPAPAAQAANDEQANPRMVALQAMQNLQAIRTKLGVPMGPAFQELEDHICAIIAILRAVKPAEAPGPDAKKA